MRARDGGAHSRGGAAGTAHRHHHLAGRTPRQETWPPRRGTARAASTSLNPRDRRV